MKDEQKTKKQLIGELEEMRHRVAELEESVVDISERTRTEEALKAERDKLQNLMGGLADAGIGIDIVGADHRIHYQNPTLMERFGNVEEKKCYEIYMDLEEPCEFCPMKEAIREQKAARRELTGADGKQYELLAVPFLSPDGTVDKAIEIIQDITERKRAEEELRVEKEFTEAALNAQSDTFFVFDPSTGQALRWNKAFNEVSGYTDDEIRSLKAPENFYSEEDLKKAATATEEILAGRIATVELSLITKDGRTVPTEYTGSNINDSDGNPRYVIAIGRDITKRRRTEEALRESEERYRTLADNSRTGIYVRQGDRLRFVNRRICEITGYTEKELLEVPVMNLVHPEDRERVREEIAVYDSGTATSRLFQCRVVTRNGESRWIELFGTSFIYEGKHAVLNNFVDVTERKLAEEALREREEEYRAVVDSSTDYFMRYDREFRHIYANPAAMKVTGLPREEYIGKTHREMGFPLHLCKLWEEHIQQVFDTGEKRMVEFEVELDEGQMYLEMQLNPELSSDGSVKSVIGMSRDMTERKRLEQKLFQAQKLESIGTLAGGIAHDFNNLLTSVLGNAELAVMHIPHFSPAINNLEEIGTAARRAADLCSQMLAYSGKGQFVVRAIDLTSLVREMSQLLEISISKKASLRYEFSGDIPAIQADAPQMHQIVMNLIINASEALGDEGGTITVKTGAMQCDQEYLRDTYLGGELPAGKYVFVEVSDTGCGMDSETLEKIFDPFFSTKFTGRGLGLAAVLGIVRGHRGAITVHTELGKGTTFLALFPCSEQPVQVAADKGAEAAEWRGSGTVLLVDDEPAVLKIGTRMLETLGFDVLTAVDGIEAVELFQQRKDEIAMVVLDVTMPRMGGEEAFEEIRKIKGDSIIILSSGYEEQDVVNRFAGQGLAGFIHKPYEFETLMKMVRQALPG